MKRRLGINNQDARGKRNVAVIAHVDHGKTTLTDSLLSRAHRLNPLKAGQALATDTMKEEQERGITIASTGVTLSFTDTDARQVSVLKDTAVFTDQSLLMLDVSTQVGSAADDGQPILPQDESVASSAEIYIGNLPRTRDRGDEATVAQQEQELETQLKAVFRAMNADIVDLTAHWRRGYAYATLDSAESAARVVSTCSVPPELAGRRLKVELRGEGVVQELVRWCTDHQAQHKFNSVSDDQVELTVSSKNHAGTDGAGPQVLFKKMLSVDGCASTIKSVRSTLAALALAQLSGSNVNSAAAISTDCGVNASSSSPSPMPHLEVSLIDCPGHVDFSGEVTAALRISDGALVVVDCVDGVRSQTETVLRQALQERVRPVLFLNKLDKAVKVSQLSGEDAYQSFAAVIARVNELIATYQPHGFDFQVDPAKGTVAFGSGLQGWGFTLPQVARKLLERKGKPFTDKDVRQLASRLWGDSFVNKTAGKWKRGVPSPGSEGYERAFSALVLKPVWDTFHAAMNESIGQLKESSALLHVALKDSVWADSTPKQLCKLLLKTWMPVADACLDMFNTHLPSPVEAQVYRAEHIYSGPEDDPACVSMRLCDADGPLMVYVAKLVQVAGTNLAIARVLSGTISAGTKVAILSSDYEPERLASGGDSSVAASSSAGGCVVGKVSSIAILNVGKDLERTHDAKAGSIVGLTGIAEAVPKTATLVEEHVRNVYPLKTLQFKVSPVVRVALTAKKPANTVKLQTIMRTMAKLDPCLVAVFEEQTGESLLCGVGELHVEVAINQLKERAGFDVVVHDPVVQYAETVTEQGPVCVTKSRNKHNRLFVKAEPLEAGVISAIEDGIISMSQSVNERVRVLADQFGWDRGVARRIVCMDVAGGNLLVDGTTGMDLSPMLDSITTAFKGVCAQSVIAGEPLRGVQLTITDAKMHADSVHRRPDQIVPMARRALMAAVLSASTAILEPIFKVELQVPDTGLSGVRQVLKARRGRITEDMPLFGTNLHEVQGLLPVAESFGFVGDLRGATSGQAYPTTTFSHWSMVEGTPAVVGGSDEACRVVTAIRDRKRMKDAVPALQDLVDRI